MKSNQSIIKLSDNFLYEKSLLLILIQIAHAFIRFWMLKVFLLLFFISSQINSGFLLSLLLLTKIDKVFKTERSFLIHFCFVILKWRLEENRIRFDLDDGLVLISLRTIFVHHPSGENESTSLWFMRTTKPIYSR